MQNKKALIAMSGGVDSSVAAWLMMNAGYDCTGATMQLHAESDNKDDTAGATMQLHAESGVCSLRDQRIYATSATEDARAVASRLGIPLYILNFKDIFTEQVIKRFISAYQSGTTPNPCIFCNRHIKFGILLQHAIDTGYGYIATGHYARVERDSGRYLLKKGLDATKDQSYVLYMMTQEQLAHTMFPLGGLTKLEVREIAHAQGLANARKRESQDICFIPDGDYARFIETHSSGGAPPQKGPITDAGGNILGEHHGIYHYTIGQRKGLGALASVTAPAPLYVCALHPENNTVVVGPHEKLFAKTLSARDINLIAVDKLDAPLKIDAKIRYNQAGQPATVYQLGADILHIEFDSPQRAITKGQSVVLYDGDIVIGGGTID